MVVHLVEEEWGGERGGLYLGYAKFCPNYLGEASGRCVRGKLIICTFFGREVCERKISYMYILWLLFVTRVLRGSRGLESE